MQKRVQPRAERPFSRRNRTDSQNSRHPRKKREQDRLTLQQTVRDTLIYTANSLSHLIHFALLRALDRPTPRRAPIFRFQSRTALPPLTRNVHCLLLGARRISLSGFIPQ